MVATSEEHEHQENQDNLNEIFEEKDDAKPPIFADTFGSNGSNDSETSGPKTPAKEVVDNDNGSALTFFGWIRKFVSSPTMGKNGIGDVLGLLDTGGAHKFTQLNAGTESEEIDNESKNKKVENDAEKEGEPTILATFGSDRAPITEACFKDEQSTTTIAKPNDLKTGVQVQDLKVTIRHNPNKVEAVKTSMVATSDEHEHQENQDNLNEISKEKDDAKPPILADTFSSNWIRKSVSSPTVRKNWYQGCSRALGYWRRP
nr:hypothetical protein [Tanacetum cinerariifolium]